MSKSIELLRRQKGMKKRGYEYEMSIPSIDSERAAIRIDNLSLAPSSGVVFGQAMTVCGVMLCAIRMKRELKPQNTMPA
jgi:hypothetical protein